MIFNGNSIDSASDILDSHFVIVGAGTLGLYMASRLRKKYPKKSILIIEAGGKYPMADGNEETSKSIGKDHQGTINSRYSGIGGTSVAWYGALVEFDEVDFKRPGQNWPISYQEVRKYYADVYAALGINQIPSKERYNRIFKTSLNGEHKLESTYIHTLKHKSQNFSRLFKKEIESDNVNIITDTTAFEMRFKDDCAKELRCISTNGVEFGVKGEKFIFASGTIGINQFFLSTKLNTKVPWSSNQNIGQYFQDHLKGEVGKLKIRNDKKFKKLFEERIIKGTRVQQRFIFNDKHRSKLQNGAVAFFIYYSKQEEVVNEIRSFIRDFGIRNTVNDLVTFIKNINKIKGYLFSLSTKYFLQNRVHRLADEGTYVIVQTEQIPIVESYITISKKEKLPNGLYKVHIHWDWNGEEMRAVHDMTMELNDYLKELEVAEIEISEDIHPSNSTFLNTFRDTSHQCGGMRMSKSQEDGVVDEYCKVWGTSNVWIAGSAVFPTSSHANTTLSALALTERIVDKSL